jgi:hypothetical protein
MTPDPGPSRPAVLRSELRFASTDKRAQKLTATYYVDRVLVNALRPGDSLYMARTVGDGLGISALRQGNLIFAAGAVCALPLGSKIQVRNSRELITAAGKVFWQRDPEFEFSELPIEICTARASSILCRGTVDRGGYHVWVAHGFSPGLFGRDECVAISLQGVCEPAAANCSAQLLEMGD